MNDPNNLPGRTRLKAWQNAKPSNFYTADPLLRQLVARSLGATFVDDPVFVDFGAACAGPIDAAVMENHVAGNLPRLERFTGIGERIESVVFHPSYHVAGKLSYETGIVACLAEPGNVRRQAVLFYLLCHNGEMGHACPITCTSGLVRALQQKGSETLKARWLPGLLSPKYETKLHGSQFLTEVQGGSDVGAIVVRAEPDQTEPGAWRLYGEKWFCSVVDADLYLVVARPVGAPEGTAGLGCFLVPRLIDGRPNGYEIRRLKEKIGTRTMASAEVDFTGALAWPIGPLHEGFKTAVGIVLNCSRLLNAVGCAGSMRRAYHEALAYARTRTAFGGPIGQFPLVRETLAQMKSETAAALMSSWQVADLVDRMDLGSASAQEQALHRLLVNANKYWTSIKGTEVIHQGIELLGGNGAIETFSVLPRLYRDAIVMESWEGAHNVLAMQVLRDATKLPLWSAADAAMRTWLEAGSRADATEAEALSAAWGRVLGDLNRCTQDPMGYGAWHIRRSVEHLMSAVQAALILDHAAWLAAHGQTEAASESIAMAGLLRRRYLAPGWSATDDETYPALVDAVLGTDHPLRGAAA